MKSLFLALAAVFLPASLFAAAPTLGSTTATVLPSGMVDVAGTVSGDGVDTTVTVHYGKDAAYGATMASTLLAAGADTPFTITLSGLELGTVYHFKVVASNGTAPDAETADATFTIPAIVLPEVTASDVPVAGGARNITAFTTSNGAETRIVLSYGETTAYGTDVAAPGPFTASRVKAPYTFVLTGLKFATAYHYKIVATNGVAPGGTTGDLTFTVPAEKPGVGIPTVNVLSSTKAIITANVAAKGADTAVRVEYGTTAGLGVTKAATTTVLAAETKDVEVTLEGLTKANYSYKVFATNGPGETAATAPLVGDLFKFTIPQVPGVTATHVASALSATVTARVTAHGDFVTLKLDYGTTTLDKKLTDITGIPDDAVNLEKVFTIPDLKKGTDYIYRVTASNSAGNGVVVNGKFKTGANKAPVAKDDSGQPKNRRPVTIDVLANDTDADGEKLTVKSVSDPRHGTAKIVDAKVVYSPNATFNGTDKFTYEVSDGQGGKDTGNVTISALQTVVDGVNSAVIKDADGNEAGAYKIIGNANGTFTARVNIGESSSVVTGKLDANGNFSTTLPNGTKVDFSVKQDGGKNSIVADFERADGKYTAETPANELTATRRSELAGLYTVTIPAPGTTGASSNGLPQGAGSMTLAAKEWGGVSVRGVLGDGSKFSYGSTVTGTNAASAIPLWLSPKHARVTGTVTLTGTTDINANGELRWYRPPNEDGSKFPEGFYTTVSASGGAYTPPEKKTNVLNSETPASTITFQGGDLASNLTANIQIDPKSRVQIPKGYVSKLDIDPKKGTFTGTFEHPIDGDRRKFQGVLTKQGVGTGVFTGQNQTGTVKITAGATAAPAPQPQPQPNPNGNPGNPQIDLGN